MTQWRDAQARQFAATAPLSSFSSMLTVHYYTHRSTDPGISHEDFLEQKSVRNIGLFHIMHAWEAIKKRLPHGHT